MRQLALDFPALDRDPAATHVDASCQRAALSALGEWRSWPGGMLALVGPEGAGKSHLAALWSGMTGARPLPPHVLSRAGQGAHVVEDADRGEIPERELLALIDEVRAGAAGPVLFTARSAPRAWPVALPDLVSRLALMPVATIGDPTDEDLGAVFAKHLGDRGVEATSALVDYVIRRVERSFAAAQEVAAALDRMALERKQAVSRALAREVVDPEQRDE
jgi:chromosomal replication initiation ATPase DnaA